MMPSAEKVVGQVIGVLSDQVLPGMPSATWDAANIRAAITLLTYVQDALAIGPAVMDAASEAMTALFASAQQLDPAFLGPDLLRQLDARRADRTTGMGAYEANKDALAALIVKSAGQRPPAFADGLREVVQQVNEADLAAIARASTLPPF